MFVTSSPLSVSLASLFFNLIGHRTNNFSNEKVTHESQFLFLQLV